MVNNIQENLNKGENVVYQGKVSFRSFIYRVIFGVIFIVAVIGILFSGVTPRGAESMLFGVWLFDFWHDLVARLL